MKKNNILLLGGFITVILAVLWYLNIIAEPVVAISSALLTFIGYLFTNKSKKNIVPNITKIKQNHSGTGDNIAGNKIIK